MSRLLEILVLYWIYSELGCLMQGTDPLGQRAPDTTTWAPGPVSSATAFHTEHVPNVKLNDSDLQTFYFWRWKQHLQKGKRVFANRGEKVTCKKRERTVSALLGWLLAPRGEPCQHPVDTDITPVTVSSLLGKNMLETICSFVEQFTVFIIRNRERLQELVSGWWREARPQGAESSVVWNDRGCMTQLHSVQHYFTSSVVCKCLQLWAVLTSKTC